MAGKKKGADWFQGAGWAGHPPTLGDGVGSALRKVLPGSWLINKENNNEKSGGPVFQAVFRIDEGAEVLGPSLRM